VKILKTNKIKNSDYLLVYSFFILLIGVIGVMTTPNIGDIIIIACGVLLTGVRFVVCELESIHETIKLSQINTIEEMKQKELQNQVDNLLGEYKAGRLQQWGDH
jgi:hypothetical protein